jgi:hypothetical protein
MISFKQSASASYYEEQSATMQFIVTQGSWLHALRSNFRSFTCMARFNNRVYFISIRIFLWVLGHCTNNTKV